MIRTRKVLLAAALAACGAGAAMADTLTTGWASKVGSAGINTTADGVVTLAPGFSDYQWISTANGSSGGGTLPTVPVGSETNGSSGTTTTFTAAANDELSFYFNYVTSDGEGFTDYAWAALFNGDGAFDSYLFTARTTPGGDTVPGSGLPGLGVGVKLAPTSTFKRGPTNFFPLDASAAACFFANEAPACGSTDWIRMTYTFTKGGTYSLTFGVTNWKDTILDSALAIAGITIERPGVNGGGNVPEPGTLVLAGIALVGLAAVRRRRG